jgi:glutamate--cysteine ligase
MQLEQTTSHAKHNGAYPRNHHTMLSVPRGEKQPGVHRVPGRTLTLRLERVLADRTQNSLVPFEGERGIEALLEQLSGLLPSFSRHVHGEHLTGLSGTGTTRTESAVDVSIGLGAGGQIVYTVGPTSSVISIVQVFEGLDRRLHTAALQLGCDYVLLGEGYNPLAESPLDVALVPRTRWTLLNAYLGQTGRYARDMMRCSCSTVASLGFATESETIAAYRLAAALSPVISFLCDNVRSFRGAGARRSPRMAHMMMCDEVDPARCGIVPGTFDKDFSLDRYLAWAEGLQPILLVDADGNTSSTGKRTTREVMQDRFLPAGEAQGLRMSALPYARLGHGVELLHVDAMRPRMAAGYAAFLKGVFLNAPALYAAAALVGNVDDEDVEQAKRELRTRAWTAKVYGSQITDFVDKLLAIARGSIDDADELSAMNELAELWTVHMVPRDAFVHQEIKAQRGW